MTDDLDPPLLPGSPLCAETDPELFFPEKGGSTRAAKRLCASCEVRSECLDYALARDERFGVWGGLSEKERRRLRKRGPSGARKPISHGTERGYKTHRRRGEDACRPCLDASRIAREGRVTRRRQQAA